MNITNIILVKHYKSQKIICNMILFIRSSEKMGLTILCRNAKTGTRIIRKIKE